MVECAGLENRWARKGPVSSNLTSSAWAQDRVGGGRQRSGTDCRRRCDISAGIILPPIHRPRWIRTSAILQPQRATSPSVRAHVAFGYIMLHDWMTINVS